RASANREPHPSRHLPGPQPPVTAGPKPEFIDLPKSRVPVTSRVDVLVVGGGSAGLSAAVAAARNGAEVLLVERFSYIGGLATGGLIILLLTMDDGAGHQAVGGICQEIVDRMDARNAVYYPPRKQSRPKLSLMPPATAISSQPPTSRTNSSACTPGSGSKCPTSTRPPFPAAASSSTRRAEVGYWSPGAAKHEAIARLTRQIPPNSQTR